MQGLTDETRRVIADLSRQYGISEDAVLAMLAAVKRGQGTMAQFNIGELGGGGQWMQGGMTMVGDMFNYSLKSTVDNLCNTLSQALASGRIDLPGETGGGAAWWPKELGAPSSVGAQNDSAYAVFPMHRRLAIKNGAGITLYDTQDHFISGVGQQQGSNNSLTFSSQYGSFAVSSLKRIDATTVAAAEAAGPVEATPVVQTSSPFSSQSQSQYQSPSPSSAQSQSQFTPFEAASIVPVETANIPDAEVPTAIVDPVTETAPSPVVGGDGAQILQLIEKLAALHQAGILTDAEFATKKTELLARL